MTDHQTPLELAEHILEIVGDRAEAIVRATDLRHGLTRFANSFIHQHVGEETRAVDLRLAVDGRAASVSTSDLSDLERFVDDTIALAEVQPVDPYWAGGASASDPEVRELFDDAAPEVTPDDRAALVEDFVTADRDLKAAGYVDSEHATVAIATTEGQSLQARSSRATLDGIHQTQTSAGSAHQTSRQFADLDGAAAGAVASDRARRSAEFADLDPGTYEVVLGPEATATIVMFLSAYGFNAKQVLEGQSFVELGEQQFDQRITLTDDPHDARAVGLPFDAEGTPKRRVVLIDQGTTDQIVHDRRTAARSDTESTGHAVPGGESFGAYPTNMVLEAGTTSRDEMIASVDRGLLITQFHYCRVLDPKTQVVTGLTRNGTFLIENGEVQGAVGNLRFTQSFLEALGPGQVVAVGDDDRFADSEFGAGFVIAPSLQLAAWNFTGGARG
ncbi:MAG: TldD/PmbA family protein [Nitriliruptorales bacterium]|nr:TldD/PmbA family protein [Nitriliruptorales bacterium]